MKYTLTLLAGLLLMPLAAIRAADAQEMKRTVTPAENVGNAVPQNVLEKVYREVSTPFKYGVVIRGEGNRPVDCPTVFRHGDKWYMVYVQLEKGPVEGYTTQLAVSDDLVTWKPLGTILGRGDDGDWDHANAGGGIGLFDTKWNGSNALLQHDGRYWLSYIGGKLFGYETTPLSIGIASTEDPSQVHLWQKLPAPVLKPDDADARPRLETSTLYKSFIFRDESKTLGAPFVMFYNAKGSSERIFTAVSDDLKTWKRFGSGPAVENLPPPDSKRGVISGDPQIVRIDDVWVMFYFGAFWQPGAFDTFACSTDLVHWTKWTGPHLIESSEPFDKQFAHKPWLIKYNGVVYHFYCAVGNQGRVIALATSKDLKNKTN